MYRPKTRKQSQAIQQERLLARNADFMEEMAEKTRANKQFSVNTNGIDGLWGKLITWIASKFGVSKASAPSHIKEYQWRTNHASKDLFLLAIKYMADEAK